MSVETAVVKSAAAGGLSAFLLNAVSDVEFIVLIMAGFLASTTSFIYDFAHKDDKGDKGDKKFDLKAATELMKYLFYGTAMMFIVYYAGIMNGNEWVQLPPIAWGFVAMLCAGSAVSIVEYVAPIFGSALRRKAEK